MKEAKARNDEIDSDDNRSDILKTFNDNNDIEAELKGQQEVEGDEKDQIENKNKQTLQAFKNRNTKEIKGTVQQAKMQLKQSTLSQHERDTIVKAVYNLAMQGIEKRNEK